VVTSFLFAPLLLAAMPAHAAENHPFASHPMTYAAGTIRPDHVSQSALDQAVRDFYDEWKGEFLSQTCGTGRYVVLSHTDGANLTVSEAHGYGMLLAALMAGHDPDARTIFDGMYAYFRDHPSIFTPNLMAWYQNKSCGDANGGDTASDGDLDIAYALLLADKQWGSCGAVDYLAAAQSVIADIKAAELDTSSQYVLLGDWVTPSDTQYYPATRSSDFMPDHYRAYLAATSDTDWTDVVDRGYDIFDAIQTTYSASTGLLPDFVVDPLGTPDPAPPGFLEGPNDGKYSYNACRNPWRLATDFVVSGDARASSALAPINAWIRTTTGNDPSQIGAGYALDGTPTPGTDYLSQAFVAPFGVGAMVDAANQAWLNDVWGLMISTPLSAEGYYENTLKLLAMIVMSGNWWAPQTVAGGCSPSGTPLCTNPASITGADVQLKKVGAPAGDESLKIKASLFFPQGAPTVLTNGAQLLLEDVGAGDAAIFDLTEATTPVPAQSAGGCGPKDLWREKATSVQYQNGSTALDPPACTLGSANGLSRIRYRVRSTRDLEVQIKTKRSTIPAVVGPLRMTLVLGADAAAGDAGECGIGEGLVCTASATAVRCQN
jgi:endo-1,4-beta-D-glucanase Y